MKIKKQELVDLWKALQQLSKQVYPVKFSYFISKNKSVIKDEIDILNDLSKAGESFMAYDNKRAKLAHELADKDIQGKPIIQDGSYVLLENKEDFDLQLKNLRESFKTAIDSHTKKLDDLNNILQEDYEFAGYKISLNHLPDEITPELMDIFIKSDLIEE